MAWIESHQDLAHHPKVARLAGMLEVSVPAAIGHLHCLWWWCLSYADDGDLTDFSDFEIGYAAQWRGEPDVFVEALQKSGWLDGREVHDWHEYGGKLAERRRQDAERKRKARAKTSTGRPPDSPQDDRADGVRREQNTTEDNTTATTANREGTALPAERWARRWCELMDLPPTRAVLKHFIPQAQDYMRANNGVEPTEGLLKRAKAAGIRTPGGWGFIANPQREEVPDWLEDHWKGSHDT